MSETDWRKGRGRLTIFSLLLMIAAAAAYVWVGLVVWAALGYPALTSDVAWAFLLGGATVLAIRLAIDRWVSPRVAGIDQRNSRQS